ncbi:MAG: TIGR03767 family metallophosphoesterase [Brevibacterium linens]
MPETHHPRLVTSTEATLVPGEERPYRLLHIGPGEAHAQRDDLLQNRSGEDQDSEEKLIAGLIHFTDFQIADLASPSRVEFLQRLEGEPDWDRMLPAYRPQEFLLSQAIELTVRGINALAAMDPDRWHLALTTGDNTDSAQANELTAFLTFLEGGRVEPAAGTRNFSDAPAGMGDPHYYNPEPSSRDHWKARKGLPSHPGALQASARAFDAQGLRLPWLSCFGNHDCLVQGRAAEPDGFETFLTGKSKPATAPDHSVPSGDKLSAYVEDPHWASEGVGHPIEPALDRRMVSKTEYIERHLAGPGLPAGHGFTKNNRTTGNAYYVYDELPSVRLIVLDTTNIAGHVDGCLDDDQFSWLEARLVEVHSSYLSADGRSEAGGEEDRVVVIASHHGLSTMTNAYGEDSGGGSDQRGKLHLAAEVESLLHRFGNVALWLSGHTHVNRITPRPGQLGGFWEVSTGSIAEWPVQFRGIEIFAATGHLRLRTTMVDSPAPAAPDATLGLADLASLHREIGANDAGSVGGLYAEGTPADRNQDLLVAVSPELLSALEDLSFDESSN